MICNRCNKHFAYKYLLVRHMNSKRQCKILNIENNITSDETIKKIYLTQIENLNKNLKYNDNLYIIY